MSTKRKSEKQTVAAKKTKLVLGDSVQSAVSSGKLTLVDDDVVIIPSVKDEKCINFTITSFFVPEDISSYKQPTKKSIKSGFANVLSLFEKNGWTLNTQSYMEVSVIDKEKFGLKNRNDFLFPLNKAKCNYKVSSLEILGTKFFNLVEKELESAAFAEDSLQDKTVLLILSIFFPPQ